MDYDEPVPSLDPIEREILEGNLRHDNERRDDALYNLEYYSGDFSRFPVRDPGQTSDGNRYERTSLFLKRVVDTLSSLLYREGPERKFPEHDQASEWLNDVYTKNNANALLQHADRLTFVSDVSLVQAEPGEDPEVPVKLRVWDASSFAVWCLPDDPCEPYAVALIDKYDRQKRMRLWSAKEIREYRTKKADEGQTSGGTAWHYVGTVPNTLGMLPFGYWTFDLQTCQFWTPGTGTHLRHCNDWINKRLTDLFDSCRYNLNPITLLENVMEGWRPPSPTKPGETWNLPPRISTAAEKEVTPTASYLQSDPAFVAAGWEDLNSGIDHELEMLGVPPAMIRLAQDAARSGVSIVAEQLEPVKAAEGRQRLAGVAEQKLAKVVLQVGARHLGRQKGMTFPVTPAQLQAAADSQSLALYWPSLYPKVPGTEADQGDQWRLDNGLTSRTQLAIERYHLTEEEAEQFIERIAEQVKRERELFGGSPNDLAANAKAAAEAAQKDLESGEEDDPEPKGEVE